MRLFFLLACLTLARATLTVGNCAACEFGPTEFHLALAAANAQNNTIALFGTIIITQSDEISTDSVYTLQIETLSIVGRSNATLRSEDMSFHNFTLFTIAEDSVSLDNFSIGNSFASDKPLIRLDSNTNTLSDVSITRIDFSRHKSLAPLVQLSSGTTFDNISIAQNLLSGPENAGDFREALFVENGAMIDERITLRDNEFRYVGITIENPNIAFPEPDSVMDARYNFWCPCPYSERVVEFLLGEDNSNVSYPFPPTFEFDTSFAQNPYNSESLDAVLWLPYYAAPPLDEQTLELLPDDQLLPGPLYNQALGGAVTIRELLEDDQPYGFVSAAHYLVDEPALVVDRAFTLSEGAEIGCGRYCAVAPTLHVSAEFFGIDLPAFVGIECLLRIRQLRVTLYPRSQLAWYRGADALPPQLIEEIGCEGSIGLTTLNASDIPASITTQAYNVLPANNDCALLEDNFIRGPGASYAAALVSGFDQQKQHQRHRGAGIPKFLGNAFLDMTRFALRLVETSAGARVSSNLFSDIAGPAVIVDRWASLKAYIGENTFYWLSVGVQFDTTYAADHSVLFCNTCFETYECFRGAKPLPNAPIPLCSNCEKDANATLALLDGTNSTCLDVDMFLVNEQLAIVQTLCEQQGLASDLQLEEFAEQSPSAWTSSYCKASTKLAFNNECLGSSGSKVYGPSIEHNTFAIDATQPSQQPVSGDAVKSFDRYRNVFVWLQPGDRVSFLDECIAPGATAQFTQLGYQVESFDESANVSFTPQLALGSDDCEPYAAPQNKAYVFGTYLPLSTYCLDPSCTNDYYHQPRAVLRAFGNVSEQCLSGELSVKHELSSADLQHNESCAWFELSGGALDKSVHKLLLDVSNQSTQAPPGKPLCLHTANLSLSDERAHRYTLELGPYDPYARCKRERINRCVACNGAEPPTREYSDSSSNVTKVKQKPDFVCDQVFDSIADALDTIFYHQNTGTEPETIYVFGNCTECNINVQSSVNIVDGSAFVARQPSGRVLASPECCAIFDLASGVDFFTLANLTLASSNTGGCDHSQCEGQAFCAVKSYACASSDPVLEINIELNTFESLACAVAVDQAVERLLVVNNSFLNIGNVSVVRNTTQCIAQPALTCAPPEEFFPPKQPPAFGYPGQGHDDDDDKSGESPACNPSSVPQTYIFNNTFWGVASAITVGTVPSACEGESFAQHDVRIVNNSIEFYFAGVTLNRIESANATFTAQGKIDLLLNQSYADAGQPLLLENNALQSLVPDSAAFCPDHRQASPVGLSLYANRVLELGNSYADLSNYHFGSHYLVLNGSYSNVSQNYGQYHISFGTACAGVYAPNIDRAMVNSSFADSGDSSLSQFARDAESSFSRRAAERNGRNSTGQESLWLENVTLEASQLSAVRYLDSDKGNYYASVSVVCGISRTADANQKIYNTSVPSDLDINEYFDSQARVRQCGDGDPDMLGANDTQIVVKQQCVDLLNHQYLSPDNNSVLECQNNEFYDRDTECCKPLPLSSFTDDIARTRSSSNGNGSTFSFGAYVAVLLTIFILFSCCLCCCFRRNMPQRTVIDNAGLDPRQLPPGQDFSQPITAPYDGNFSPIQAPPDGRIAPISTNEPGAVPPEGVYSPTRTGGTGIGYQGQATAYTFGDQYLSTPAGQRAQDGAVRRRQVKTDINL